MTDSADTGAAPMAGSGAVSAGAATASSPEPDPFPTPWETERDPELTWEWDDMHTPFALSPLAQDYVRTLGAGFNLCYELYGGFPQRYHTRIWNGYAYFGYDPGLPEDERPANRERWLAAMRARVPVTEAYWRDEVLPEIQALEAEMRAMPVESASPAELVAIWDRAWAITRRMWDLHFCIIIGPYMVVEDLVDLFERHLPGRPPGEAGRLTQGTSNEIVETERGMERLAAIAGTYEALAAMLITAATGPADARRAVLPADLDGLAGGAELRTALEAFLARHGHLGMNGEDLELVPWAEDPAAVLANLGARLAAPPEPSGQRLERLVAGAEALADEVRVVLTGRADELAEFERLYRLSRTIGPITETHNYWIDRMAQARLRRVALRFGDRLVAAGCFDARADVLALHRDEVRELIEHPADRRALVTARRAEQERQRTLTPPAFVGKPPKQPEPDRFSGVARPSEAADLLLGTGSSAGVARGPARVALGPDDFARVQPGDIVVCPASNPSWVPVFTIAGGLVTNTGGILSHAAVVAREFGLPAVTGVAGATTKIADGRLVEIDGTKGSVRLL